MCRTHLHHTSALTGLTKFGVYLTMEMISYFHTWGQKGHGEGHFWVWMAKCSRRTLVLTINMVLNAGRLSTVMCMNPSVGQLI